MPGMLNLFLVLELVIDGLNDGSASEHNLVHEGQQFIFHVPSNAGNELGALFPQGCKQVLGNVTTITEDLTVHGLGELGNGLDVVVRHVAGSDEEGYEFTVLIDDEVKFESVEPTH